jgi:phosphopantetheinyl transferase (holo-ACP synthase)
LILIGNDIVDLTDPQNMGKSRDTRFINRVFGPCEQDLISRAENQDAILWALWAGKETAYKLVKKHHPSANSIPRSYKVSLDCAEGSHVFSCRSNDLSGFVDTPYGRIEIKVFITSDYVHCIGAMAGLDEMDCIVWDVDRIRPDLQASPAYQSAFVRKALRERLSIFCDESPDDIEIRREKTCHGLGPPFVCINGRQAAVDVSLSHDGCLAAYAFAATAASSAVSEGMGHQEWSLQ